MGNIFDKLTEENKKKSNIFEPSPSNKEGSAPKPPIEEEDITSKSIKNVVQELLRYGLIESDRKPNFFQTAVTQHKELNQILEPLDLCLKIDDIRGLVLLIVADSFISSTEVEDDKWSHPLIRRHRFTLEQSLLIAILRQIYVAHEGEAGIGSNTVVAIYDITPQVQLYLGSSGSDIRDQKRLRNLLENLKSHGIISEIDDKDLFVIRPIITHLANPETLERLLEYYKEVADGHSKVSNETKV